MWRAGNWGTVGRAGLPQVPLERARIDLLTLSGWVLRLQRRRQPPLDQRGGAQSDSPGPRSYRAHGDQQGHVFCLTTCPLPFPARVGCLLSFLGCFFSSPFPLFLFFKGALSVLAVSSEWVLSVMACRAGTALICGLGHRKTGG